MPVPFIDLTRDTACYEGDYLEATKRVLRSGIFSLGPEVEGFEREFALFHGVSHAIGVNGGSWALYAAFRALDLKPGDKALLPANTFIATATAAILAGIEPVFCDIDERTCLLDLQKAERLMEEDPGIKVIVPVHLYGKTLDMSQVMDIAQRHQVFVIEDVAQAHGAYSGDKRVGSYGHLACFSFYPTKPLGALGEGGMVLTNDAELARRVRAIRLHGILEEKYRHDIFGTNLKMEALQAAYLRLKLVRLNQANERRRAIAQRYVDAFKDLALGLPTWKGGEHAFHLFVIQTDQRDALQTFLKEKGIGSAIHYPLPVHKQPSMKVYAAAACPVAETVAKRILSLPLFPEMKEEEVEEVIAAINGYFSKD